MNLLITNSITTFDNNLLCDKFSNFVTESDINEIGFLSIRNYSKEPNHILTTPVTTYTQKGRNPREVTPASSFESGKVGSPDSPERRVADTISRNPVHNYKTIIPKERVYTVDGISVVR